MDVFSIAYFLAGGVALYLGADWLVAGGAAIAKRFNVSPVVIGLTIVAYGTSLPEFFVTSTATLGGSSGVAIGNVLGSNICNIALILGLASVVTPMAMQNRLITREIPLLLVVSAFVVWIFLDGTVSRGEGGALLCFGLGFTVSLFMFGGTDEVDPDVPEVTGKSVMTEIGLLVVGMAGLYLGGEWFVTGAIDIATALGVSDRLIGVTLVALGTSLPELVTVMLCVARGEQDIGIGNLIGSNFFNLTFVLGGAAIVSPVAFTGGGQWLDAGVALLLPLLLLPIAGGSMNIGRIRGGVLVCIYVVYIGSTMAIFG